MSNTLPKSQEEKALAILRELRNAEKRFEFEPAGGAAWAAFLVACEVRQRADELLEASE